MIRALSTLAAIVALAVSVTPASAGLLSSPLGLTTKPKPAVQFEEVHANLKAARPKAGPSKARVGGKMHLEDVSMGFTKHYDMSSPY